MNTTKSAICKLSEIKEGLVYKHGRYRYIKYGQEVKGLPIAKLEDKEILEILGISYLQKVDDILEYWDASYYEEEEKELPIYIAESGNVYRFVGYRKEKILTKQTIEAAWKLETTIAELLREEEEERYKKDFINFFKEKLNGKYAIEQNNDCRSCFEIWQETDIILGNEHIMIFPVYVLENSCFINFDDVSAIDKRATKSLVIFDVGKIKRDGLEIIEIEVDKEKVSIFNGRKKWQVREWCRKIGIQWIDVKGINCE